MECYYLYLFIFSNFISYALYFKGSSEYAFFAVTDIFSSGTLLNI